MSVESLPDGTNRLDAKFQYRNPVSETFAPEASKYKKARASAFY